MLSRLNGMHTCEEELAALIFQPLVDKLLLLLAAVPVVGACQKHVVGTHSFFWYKEYDHVHMM